MKAAVVPPSPKVIGLRAVTAMSPPQRTCRVRSLCAAPLSRRQRGSLIEVNFAPWRALFFQRLEISNHVRNLARVEPELRHCRMTCDDAFRESLFQVYDRILGMDDAEGRRDRERAGTHLVDRVALRTVYAYE